MDWEQCVTFLEILNTQCMGYLALLARVGNEIAGLCLPIGKKSPIGGSILQ